MQKQPLKSYVILMQMTEKNLSQLGLTHYTHDFCCVVTKIRRSSDSKITRLELKLLSKERDSSAQSAEKHSCYIGFSVNA